MGLGIALSQLAKQFNTLSSERAIETFGIDVDKTADAIMNAHSELDKLIKLTPLTVPAVEGSAEDSAKDWYDDWAYYGNELTRLWDGRVFEYSPACCSLYPHPCDGHPGFDPIHTFRKKAL